MYGMIPKQNKKITPYNKQASKEWLIKSWHKLSTAQLLYAADHFTDVIAVELHYSCEKMSNSLLVKPRKLINAFFTTHINI